jgi:ribosomal protein L32
MGLPGHRRTSSHKRRRASHFALTAPAITTSKGGAVHRMHVAAPGATEYNGHAIHVKGRDRKVAKLLAKSRKKSEQAHEHDHEHDHDHDHQHETK